MHVHRKEPQGLRFIGATLVAVSSFVFVMALAPARSVRATSAPTIVSKFVSATANGMVDSYAGGTIDNLVAGGVRTIYINGVVEDLDGQGDITEVDVKFYRSGAGAGCTTSQNDCYIFDNCVLDTENVTSNQKRYNCSLNIQYFADSTSTGGEFPSEAWVVDVTVKDTLEGSSNDTSLTKDMQTLLALAIPTSINYGALSLNQGTTGATNVAQVISQAGNDLADVEVSSAQSGMLCTIGSIPRANQQWSLTDVGYGGMGTTALSASATDTNLAVPYRHGNNPTQSLFWNILVPESGLGGTCSGTVNVSTIAG